MANRLDLHEMLCDIIGSRNVYFQPPESVKMQYPAIKYSLSNIKNNHANDKVYTQSRSYQIIVIDKSPDSAISDKVSQLPYCKFDRSYVSDGLNHYVYTLY